MNQFKKIIVATLITSITLTLAGCSKKADDLGTTTENQNVKVKVGVVGENNEQWEYLAQQLKDEGIDIELVKFADYSLPNQALADKDIDLNTFQHYAYLDSEIKSKGLKLTPIGETIIAPLGLYSKKVTSVNEIKTNDKIAIPSDATNGGRALKLLEAAGLLTIDPAALYLPTIEDITSNPLNLEIYEVGAENTPSLLPDVSAAIINGGHAVDNGLHPATDAIFLESIEKGSENPYINIIVARTEDADNEIYQKIVKAYQTDEVAQVIEDAFQGAYLPAWK